MKEARKQLLYLTHRGDPIETFNVAVQWQRFSDGQNTKGRLGRGGEGEHQDMEGVVGEDEGNEPVERVDAEVHCRRGEVVGVQSARIRREAQVRLDCIIGVCVTKSKLLTHVATLPKSIGRIT